jgi:hypothetical protein
VAPTARHAAEKGGMNGFVIAPSDRVLIVGRTGSGKSTLARALFYGSRQLVVVDPKHEEVLPRSVTVWSAREFSQVYPQRTTRVLVRPDPEDPRSGELDDIIRRILRYGRTCLLLHETVDYATPTRILPALRRAQKTGRSLDLPVVSCSQRPIGLHNDIISEADHVFAFDLGLDGDREKIAGVGGPGFLERPSHEHGFLYWGHRTTGGRVVSCPPLVLPASPPPAGTAATAADTGGATWSGRPSAT